ncbi:single-stranded-DNA-specific exonuclease RecJ [Halorubrum lacusprofundi]|jgi:RecJ-like exonuclease|uniref:Phosphoesterase DHHA1 n=1 Tax=Halorubrum lacusprofundi (strain ATCC 49239 / DSM 5036 / JCM 8891 / ACAM 34) TaxID=416348 RepID=B9LTF2_HALLT|nr:DHH family phosphoesterase [Halorubrum lacusprofundi]ACM58124.1 phosphoesterase DHHA1 [Halorubrum lacusprofundi ATCC 49239]MCG1006206.1 DHH family phosphoesterase [Halorubrum lacusprofundi]
MAVADPPVPELTARANACAGRLRAADRVLLASHIDADGLTSGAVASTALARAGIDHEVVFEKQLDAESIAGIAAREFDVVLFTDFGSGQLDVIVGHEDRGDFVPVIADHHQPADRDTDFHLNPLLEGLNGASELSGAGASYVLARALEGPDGDNRDLAALAVVGAVGDMQDSDGGLIGANEAIVADGVDAGVIETRTDLDLYGRQTRPLPKLLEYASDVKIPGVSNDEAGAISFLTDLDIEVKRDGEWRRWVDLDAGERQILASGLMRRAVASGVPADRIEALVGTSYTLVDEEPGTELRDVSEFSTLLNATARYERADVGLAVCLGDRGDALSEARRLLRNHRKNLSEGLQWVKSEGVTEEQHLQWFDAGSRIRETIVGIVAGMAIGSPALDRSKPVIAFAEESAEELKVSSRGSHSLVRQGLDLSAVMREASQAVGGDGGGHDVAAGATIPIGERDAFVAEADRLIGEQLS